MDDFRFKNLDSNMTYNHISTIINPDKHFPDFIFSKKFDSYRFLYFERVFVNGIGFSIRGFPLIFSTFLQSINTTSIGISDTANKETYSSQYIFNNLLREIKVDDNFISAFINTISSSPHLNVFDNLGDLSYYQHLATRPVIFDWNGDIRWIIYFDRVHEIGVVGLENSVKTKFDDVFKGDFPFLWENSIDYLTWMKKITKPEHFEELQNKFAANYSSFSD